MLNFWRDLTSLTEIPAEFYLANLRTIGNNGCKKFLPVNARENEGHAIQVRRLISHHPLEQHSEECSNLFSDFIKQAIFDIAVLKLGKLKLVTE